MRHASLVLLGCLAAVSTYAQAPAKPAASGMPPHTASGMPPTATMPPHAGAGGAAAAPMGVSPSTEQRIVWSCQLDKLGNTAVMVNFVDKTALSTRAAGMGKATISGDQVRWTETEPDGVLKYLLDRKSGELQVTQVPAKGKEVVHKGKCGPPAKKGGKHM